MITLKNICVRKADKKDLNSWALMRTSLWPSSSHEQHLADLNKELKNLDSFQGWIALDGDKYIGFAEASVRPFANGCVSRPVVFFEGIWIDESYRQSGVGREFVKAVESWAKIKGFDEIGSDAEVENNLSHLCHKKWGFEERERVVYYRKKII